MQERDQLHRASAPKLNILEIYENLGVEAYIRVRYQSAGQRKTVDLHRGNKVQLKSYFSTSRKLHALERNQIVIYGQHEPPSLGLGLRVSGRKGVTTAAIQDIDNYG